MEAREMLDRIAATEERLRLLANLYAGLACEARSRPESEIVPFVVACGEQIEGRLDALVTLTRTMDEVFKAELRRQKLLAEHTLLEFYDRRRVSE